MLTSILCSFIGKGLRAESKEGVGTTISFWLKQEGLISNKGGHRIGTLSSIPLLFQKMEIEKKSNKLTQKI
jgi:hypothetical protein